MYATSKWRWMFGAALVVLLLAIGMMGVSCKKGQEAPPPAQPVASQPAGAYSCPMHPQITATTPGKCPICGMALVEAKPAETKAGK